MPITRHFVDTGLISANFRQRFEDAGAFKRAVSSARWKALGAEVFNKKLFVPGDLWTASPLLFEQRNGAEHLYNG